eukprot:TRINITY_DN21252_c0_g4_i1.p1 TRINITY_DN21252_c0_g4~~TRINITY_DN21252_c0_g4_i1.p1  ORF type:complete len:148 (-),score=13.67 TRINITY_DN21252_c0_g4_i1:155-577(-)
MAGMVAGLNGSSDAVVVRDGEGDRCSGEEEDDGVGDDEGRGNEQGARERREICGATSRGDQANVSGRGVGTSEAESTQGDTDGERLRHTDGGKPTFPSAHVAVDGVTTQGGVVVRRCESLALFSPLAALDDEPSPSSSRS